MMIEREATALQCSYDEDERLALMSTNTCNSAPESCAVFGDRFGNSGKVQETILEAQLKPANRKTYTRFLVVENRWANRIYAASLSDG